LKAHVLSLIRTSFPVCRDISNTYQQHADPQSSSSLWAMFVCFLFISGKYQKNSEIPHLMKEKLEVFFFCF